MYLKMRALILSLLLTKSFYGSLRILFLLHLDFMIGGDIHSFVWVSCKFFVILFLWWGNRY
jgi:hypothetical protein